MAEPIADAGDGPEDHAIIDVSVSASSPCCGQAHREGSSLPLSGGRYGKRRGGSRAAVANVEAWVAGWFAPNFARRLGAARWCASWWRHAEAIVRLEALRRSWEALRLDPAFGVATWLRDHLDPQRAVLMGNGGPFQACEGHEHNPPPELPVTPAPADYWPAPHVDRE